MSALHALYHYSVTIKAIDKSVLGALRGLSFEVETAASSQISSGGTTGDVWEKNDKQVKMEIESGIDPDNSLLPMLIGGLVLIVIGAIVVMMFV